MIRTLAFIATVVCFTSCGNGEPTVSYGSIDGRPSAVAALDGKLWIADDEEHVVHVVDAESLETIGRPVEVAKNPIAVEAGAGMVWVAHANGVIEGIDAKDREVVVERDVGESVTGIALDGHKLWAADIASSELVGMNDDGTVDHRVPIPDGAVRVETGGGAVWLSGQEDTVAKVEPPWERANAYPAGNGPIGLGWNVRAWVANSDDDTVSSVGKAVTVAVGNAPIALEFTADGTMWVANQDDQTLSVVRDFEQTDVVPLDLSPREMATDGRVVWVVGTNRNAVARVEP